MLPNIHTDKPSFIPNTEFDNQQQNHRALLSSNETVPKDFFSNINPRPDGTLVGVGIGMSLGMLEAFDNGPQNIILFDINQHVVASGRIFIEMLKQSADFQTFETNLKNIDLVESLYHKVTETEPLLKDQNADINDLTEFIHDQFFNFVKDKRSQIHRSVENKFSQIKQLAENDKFNMYLGDIGNGEWANALGTHIVNDPGTHLVYLSNTPDYICRDQSRTRQLNLNLDKISSTFNSPPVWVDTLYTSEYVLNSHTTAPHFRTQIGDEHYYAERPVRGQVKYLEEHSLEHNPIIVGIDALIRNRHSRLPVDNELVIPQPSVIGPDWLIGLHRLEDKIDCSVIGVTREIFEDNPENRQFLLSFLPVGKTGEFGVTDDVYLDTTFAIDEPIVFTLPNGQKIKVEPQGASPSDNQYLITNLPV